MEQHLRTLQAAVHRLAQDVFDDLDPHLQAAGLIAAVSLDDHKPSALLLTPEETQRDPTLLLDAAQRAHLGFRKAARDDPSDAVERDGLRHAMLRGALQDVFAATVGRLGFVGPPRTLGDWRVAPVLQVEAALYPTHYALQNRGEESATLPTSLLDAAGREVLRVAAAAISDYSPQARVPLEEGSADEVLRAAGRHLMAVPATAAGTAGGRAFYTACDMLATLRYEGGEGRGRMLIAARGHPDVDVLLRFHEPVSLLDHQGVRKVLELTEHDLCLLTDATEIHGLGRALDTYDPAGESRFDIEFTGRSAWVLAHGDVPLMRVTHGLPELAQDPIDEEAFGDALQRTLGEVGIEAFERLLAIALAASRQHHGTTVVITSGAREEALRLGSQALRIDPVGLTPDIVRLVSESDGALLVDDAGVCHAIGVSLDGSASRRGDPARGARFNSAVRYVDEARHPSVVLVISGDGSVDLITPV